MAGGDPDGGRAGEVGQQEPESVIGRVSAMDRIPPRESDGLAAAGAPKIRLLSRFQRRPSSGPAGQPLQSATARPWGLPSQLASPPSRGV